MVLLQHYVWKPYSHPLLDIWLNSRVGRDTVNMTGIKWLVHPNYKIFHLLTVIVLV